jgi:hypothetical protein
MKQILLSRKLLFWLASSLLLLSACAGPQTIPQRTIIDNSQPNIPSLYYYISASLQYYAGTIAPQIIIIIWLWSKTSKAIKLKNKSC